MKGREACASNRLTANRTYLYAPVPGYAAGLVLAVVATLAAAKQGAEVQAIFDKAVAEE
ncbi:MAG: hypothetical protein J5985_03115 [Kiritimatiellae bacterium]|nr:hypothetical protein [Kiritimatiellia bacterium]